MTWYSERRLRINYEKTEYRNKQSGQRKKDGKYEVTLKTIESKVIRFFMVDVYDQLYG